jgi:hypothetical protein
MFSCLAMTWLALVLSAGGCAQKPPMDAAVLEQAFTTAPPADQNSLAQVVSAVQRKDYAGALAMLQLMQTQPQFSPGQKEAMARAIQQLQAFLGAATSPAADAPASPPPAPAAKPGE